MAIGLGCMRLSTDDNRDEGRASAVIRAALDAGATLLDTADAYCRDERDTGHNERVIAQALAAWSGDRSLITIATKGGLRRPKGQWVNDGRAKHLKEACDASRAALGVDCIDVYQLHAVDPKVDIETSVRALAALQQQGKIREIGLCNVTVDQIVRARALTSIASVQVSLSTFDDENLRNGVAEYCRDNGIRVIAYRPLGGERMKRLARDAIVAGIAAKHGAAAGDVALAWLLSFEGVVPIPGPTRVATAQGIARAAALQLDEDDREALDARFSGRLLRVPRAQRRPAPRAEDAGEVVIVMGMPGAGKTTYAQTLEARGYSRLNRDALGGSLADLIPQLDTALGQGAVNAVLDNTYPTRASRNAVIETAWARGLPARCLWLATTLGDAQVNAIHRMIDTHGSLPSPEEIRARTGDDPRYLLPDALFRYERILEPPTLDEGFESVERIDFSRRADEESPARAIIFDADDVLDVEPSDAERRLAKLTAFQNDGWLLFAHAWRPQIARGTVTFDDVEQELAHLRLALSGIDVAYCGHDAGPPICWCRKPIPGSVVAFARRRGVSLRTSIVVGKPGADRTMADRIGARFAISVSFFGS
jgi:aryl-alcohol dehydrogenase-like predicted oxidoreductase/predicted kinase/histidinol phosphatase-like enzyme